MHVVPPGHIWYGIQHILQTYRYVWAPVGMARYVRVEEPVLSS